VSIEASPTGEFPEAPGTRTFGRVRVFGNVIKELWGDKAGTLGAILVLIIVIAAILAPVIVPHDPTSQSLHDRLTPPFWYPDGSATHILGTDDLGRDVLSRIIYGARTSIIIATIVVLLAGAFGVSMGLYAGYKGGRTDTIIMRIVDTQLAFPGLLLALIIITTLGASFALLVIILAIDGWMVYARMTRGIVLSAREKPYVEAAELVGCGHKRIIFRHILPNLLSPLITLAILEFARVVIAEAALSFIGIGIQPPQISWGLDVTNGRNYIFNAWWLVTFPGIAIAVTVLGLNLVASWLRIFSDPQEREKRYAASVMGRRRIFRRRKPVPAPATDEPEIGVGAEEALPADPTGRHPLL
jgi:peptide/nickel transport system permease protein